MFAVVRLHPHRSSVAGRPAGRSQCRGIAFLPPGENAAPVLQIRRSESHADGGWIAEAYELSPCGYPCNDGIDVLCVQWEGCGPTEVDGLRICSSGCPSMERWYVRSSRPGVVEFEWYERTSDEGVIEFDTKTFYSSLDDCLAASSASRSSGQTP